MSGRVARRLRRLGTRRTRLLVTAAIVAAGVGLAVQALGLLSQLTLDTVDARFSIRGRVVPSPHVVVVGIDKHTNSAPPDGLGLRYPFPRRVDARLIDILRADHAAVIVFDVEFVVRTDPTDDTALLEAIARARNVVLATTVVGAGGSTDVLGGESVLHAVHATAGFSVLPADRGGVLRRMYYAWHRLPSLGVAAAARYLRHPPPPRHLRSDGTAWIDYPGPQHTVSAVSYSDVLHGRLAPRTFAGRIVVVGASDPSLQDVHATSTVDSSALMSGPEIQADSIATALGGFPLRSAPAGVTVLSILVLAALPALAGLRLAPLPALLATAAGAALFALAAQLAFNGNVIVEVVTPLLACAVGAVGALLAGYVDETFRRESTRLAFARFVPEAVVDEVLAATDSSVRLGGTRRTATVMFSDLRGFTSFSERRDPEQVIEILNRYLTAMSDAILGHGGTLVAYMGDGIMAVFGAPLAQEDHADRALAAAREMLDRLERFNEWLATEHGAEPLRMGIGLNSGLVMSGNVGSDRRLEYTALGDTTNTASRLEGMTKGTPHQLFVAQSTHDALHAVPEDLVFVAEREVRGRHAPIRIWTLAGTGGALGAGTEAAPAAADPEDVAPSL